MDTSRLPSVVRPLLILGLLAFLILAMHLVASFLIPLILALFFSVLLNPLYSLLKEKRVPPILALLLTIGFLVMVALGFVMLMGNAATTLITDLSKYNEELGQRQEELSTLTATMGQFPGLQTLLSALSPANLTEILKQILVVVVQVMGMAFYVFILMIFFLMEGGQFGLRMQQAFGADHPVNYKSRLLLKSFVRYFGLRTIVNLITATGVTIALWVLGIDNAGLWGVLTFFLSYIPYIGIVIALTPPVILAYAEYGLGMAIVVIILAIVINGAAENIVAPLVMGKGLKISPTVVFVSFIFWMAILGGSGALVAMPLTVAMIMIMGGFAETHPWAALLGSIPEEPLD
jgi:AI-2 transport protein TqsA